MSDQTTQTRPSAEHHDNDARPSTPSKGCSTSSPSVRSARTGCRDGFTPTFMPSPHHTTPLSPPSCLSMQQEPHSDAAITGMHQPFGPPLPINLAAHHHYNHYHYRPVPHYMHHMAPVPHVVWPGSYNPGFGALPVFPLSDYNYPPEYQHHFLEQFGAPSMFGPGFAYVVPAPSTPPEHHTAPASRYCPIDVQPLTTHENMSGRASEHRRGRRHRTPPQAVRPGPVVLRLEALGHFSSDNDESSEFDTSQSSTDSTPERATTAPQPRRHSPPSFKVNSRPLQLKIDISLIRAGREIRTTIMLRNIPNRFKRCHITARLEQLIPDGFDVVYLPIDFTRLNNFGFAFVNLTSAEFVIPLIEHMSGRVWPGSSSPKICEINFARIQGRHQLIEHYFRHTRLMHLQDEMRPLILSFDNEDQFWEQGMQMAGVDCRTDRDNNRSLPSENTVPAAIGGTWTSAIAREVKSAVSGATVSANPSRPLRPIQPPQ